MSFSNTSQHRLKMRETSRDDSEKDRRFLTRLAYKSNQLTENNNNNNKSCTLAPSLQEWISEYIQLHYPTATARERTERAAALEAEARRAFPEKKGVMPPGSSS